MIKCTDEVGNKTTWKILNEEMEKRQVWFDVGSGGGPQDQTCGFARRTLALWFPEILAHCVFWACNNSTDSSA